MLNSPVRSRPSRGAWIETMTDTQPNPWTERRAPHGGAWIETQLPFACCDHVSVAPLTAARVD